MSTRHSSFCTAESAFPLFWDVATNIPLTFLCRLMVVREMNREILWIVVYGRLATWGKGPHCQIPTCQTWEDCLTSSQLERLLSFSFEILNLASSHSCVQHFRELHLPCMDGFNAFAKIEHTHTDPFLYFYWQMNTLLCNHTIPTASLWKIPTATKWHSMVGKWTQMNNQTFATGPP